MHDGVTVRVRGTARARAETVFDLIDAARDWPRWSPVQAVCFEREADEIRQDVGARRTFVTGPLRVREQVTVRRPNRQIDYILLDGLPLDDYVGSVTLVPIEDGTRIEWIATFRPRRRRTGWFWRLAIRLIILRTVRGAIRAAEGCEVEKMAGRVG